MRNIVAALVGAVLGALAGLALPISAGLPTPLWLCIPFGALLLTIAIAPLTIPSFWHNHYPTIALALGGLVLGYEVVALGAAGARDMLHAVVEFYQFIALVGGLFVASGGILINTRDSVATPLRNTALLAAGALLSNILGTTGASVILIRPFMRMNRGRCRPIHVVFFIFIVSNCGGALTPIGDPPLYLGYLKGVPFFWPVTHLWPMWLLVNGLLLGIFFVTDSRIPRPAPRPRPTDRTPPISGWFSAICLLLLVSAVFIDPALQRLNIRVFDNIPIGATVQILLAVAAYSLSNPETRRANQFTFEPVREVGYLFAGIFLTMVPALAWLRAHASSLGLQTPTHFHGLTGGLSAVLDNAPTYVSFLQAALGVHNLPLEASGIRQFLALKDGPRTIEAISLGAVFFGAMTYIGNGPNFMVRSIVESTQASSAESGLGARPPSFFGYSLYALVLLLPVLILNWFIFIR